MRRLLSFVCWVRGHSTEWTVVMRDAPDSEAFTKCRRCHGRVPVPRVGSF